MPLQVDGVLDNWQKRKTFNFSSCDKNNPGELIINGTDFNHKDHCTWGGMMLHCAAFDETSPWHKFTSNVKNWVNNEDSYSTLALCSNDKGMVQVGKVPQELQEKGAKKIWTYKKKASLRGSPRIKISQNCFKIPYGGKTFCFGGYTGYTGQI